jgi:hypothetical protein
MARTAAQDQFVGLQTFAEFQFDLSGDMGEFFALV